MTNYQDVLTFHRAFHDPPQRPIPLSSETWQQRVRLILEELSEVAHAQALGDFEGVADGLVDLVWVVMGTAVEAGLPWEALWNEVRRANMDKVAHGVRLDGSGKVVKPDGWKPPDIERVMWEAL